MTPEEYAAQFKRAKRYYNALIVFVCIDIIPLMWLALFFIYFPVVIYTWVFAFGKPILLPNDEAVAENNQLGKFIIMSWIPAIGIVADIAILVKVLHLKKLIKTDVYTYTTEYNKHQQMLKDNESTDLV